MPPPQREPAGHGPFKMVVFSLFGKSDAG